MSWNKREACNVTHLWCTCILHVPGWLLKWLNLITAPGSVSNEPGSVTWLATKYLKTFSWRNHTEKLTTLWPQNTSFWPKINTPSSNFYCFNAKLLRKYSQTPVWQLCDNCQILDLINFPNNLTWPNSNTAGISLDSRLEYSKITHMYAKKTLHSLGSCTEKFPLIKISSILSVNFTSTVA